MPVAKFYKTLGRTIRRHRLKHGWSQEELAERAELHRNYVGEIERAEKKATLDALVKLCKAFKIRLRDVVKDI